MRTTILLASFLLAPALTFAQQPCTSDADSTVDAIYRQVLERPASGEGNARADQLRNGQTSVREIVRDLATSPEHLQRFMPANNRTEAVTNLYRHVLGRSPDPGGLNSHVQSRDSMAALVDTFINSPEYQQKFGEDGVPGGNRRYCRGSGGFSNNGGFGNNGRNRRSEGFEDQGDRSDRFATLDTNGNGRIERREWQGSPDAFDWLDRNGDNVLSRAEVVGDGSGRDGSGRDGSGRFDSFNNIDTNRDGTIRPDEWRWSRRLFDQYDTDGDGFITRREFAMGGGAPSSR